MGVNISQYVTDALLMIMALLSSASPRVQQQHDQSTVWCCFLPIVPIDVPCPVYVYSDDVALPALRCCNSCNETTSTAGRSETVYGHSSMTSHQLLGSAEEAQV